MGFVRRLGWQRHLGLADVTVSVGAATDYVYAKAQAAVVGVTVNGKPAVAIDGEPEELTFGMFVVGVTQPPPDGAAETTGTRSWMGLGAKRLEEDYILPCYIDVRSPGRVQKTPRDIALSIFNTFWASIASDLTLGGALQGGRYAEIVDFITHAGTLGTVAEPGRRQLVMFGVHCRNLTT